VVTEFLVPPLDRLTEHGQTVPLDSAFAAVT
jgi:hypothetical protein